MTRTHKTAPALPFLAAAALLAPLGLVAPLTPVAHASRPCRADDSARKGQQRIDQGRYEEALEVFSCVIRADQRSFDGYRGRAEASLLLGRFSDAMGDYARITAQVMPTDPDAPDELLAAYDARLAARPADAPALTGASFAHWWYFDYAAALPLLSRLLTLRPNDLYGTLYRGSNRLFLGNSAGAADLSRAITLSPRSADVRFIVADAYTYAQPDPARALAQASLALHWGLDTPRVQAILASASFALGNDAVGAAHLERHIELVTTEPVSAPPLPAGGALALDLRPGRTYAIPVVLGAGQALSIRTESPSGEIGDSVAVLLAPDGTPVVGNDDFIDYLAGFDWVAPQAGTYTLRVTSFEGVSTGALVVTRG